MPQSPGPFSELVPAAILLASVACAVVSLWHPWAAFIGTAFAALTPIRHSRKAMAAVVLNGVGAVVGVAIWIVRVVA